MKNLQGKRNQLFDAFNEAANKLSKTNGSVNLGTWQGRAFSEIYEATIFVKFGGSDEWTHLVNSFEARDITGECPALKEVLNKEIKAFIEEVEALEGEGNWQELTIKLLKRAFCRINGTPWTEPKAA